MKTHAIIQARSGSTRFPNKIFAEIDGKPLLWHVVNRLKDAAAIDGIIVATTVNPEDDITAQWCQENGVACFRGSAEDVLNRYYEASLAFPSDAVARITADDPFKEPAVVDAVVRKVTEEGADLATNNLPPTFPEGLDCEVFPFRVLEQMEKEAADPFEREHVTQYVYRHPDRFRIANVASGRQLSHLRWTIDTEEDLAMVRAVYARRIRPESGMIRMDEILEILEKHPEIPEMNAKVKRSAMYRQSGPGQG